MVYFLKRLKWRVIWSWKGTVETWSTEHSFRTWVWANLISGLLAFVLPLTSTERALILALGILVLAAELLNTAIEHAIDYISTEQNELARKAKDAGSAGVAVTAIAAGVVWIVYIVRLI